MKKLTYYDVKNLAINYFPVSVTELLGLMAWLKGITDKLIMDEVYVSARTSSNLDSAASSVAPPTEIPFWLCLFVYLFIFTTLQKQFEMTQTLATHVIES